MIISGLFPIPIAKFSIDSIHDNELSLVKKYQLNCRQDFGNVSTNEKNVLDKELPRIRQFIENSINEYVDNIICPKYDLNFYITQSWITFTNPGGFHHSHSHKNSIISGVFYFNAEDGKDEIMFMHDRESKNIIIERKSFNLYNCTSWNFPVKTGDLIIFPSDLEHCVSKTLSDSLRISLAFNVFARGNFGGHENLEGLIL